MGHTVGDQANRAVKKGEKKAAEALRTPEERLAAIRGSVAAKLYVTQDDIRFLLEKYDRAHELMVQNTTLLQNAIVSMDAAYQERDELKVQVEQFRTVYEQENRSTTLKVERTLDDEFGTV